VKEFDIFVPLTRNDGTPIEPKRLRDLKTRLLEYFNGVTFFPQINEGLWRMGGITFKDEIVIYRVVAANAADARRFLRQLKKELKRAMKQEDIFIIERDVEIL
jgi:hypothetical protein